MIPDSVKAALDAEIDPERVKHDSQIAHGAGYLAAYDVIEAANNIFGYDGWSFELLEVTLVQAVDLNGSPTGALYMARGRLQVGEAVRVDIGTNDVSYRRADGNATPDAYETAIKGAVSDCLKRCLRTFGNQFGNSLYEKPANNRQQPPAKPAAKPAEKIEAKTCAQHENAPMKQSGKTKKWGHQLPDKTWCVEEAA